jgi:DNA-binding transcriptional LysR family regulator
MNRIHELDPADLTVLATLDVVLAHGGVAPAARALGVTPSAVSHTLRRARELLGDPLLVRRGDGLVPTPRAEALRAPLREALAALGRAVRPDTFDPARARRTFRLAAPDLFALVALPAIWAVLAAEAPGVDLVVLPPTTRRDDVDLFVVPDAPWAAGPARPSEHVQRALLRDTYACFVAAGHLSVGDLDAWAARDHLVVSPDGEGPSAVDHALAAIGLRRRVAVRVAGFAEAAVLVARSDLVLTAPRAFRRLVDPARVVEVVPPLPLPAQSIALRWHARWDGDAGHAWLREVVLAAVVSRPEVP